MLVALAYLNLSQALRRELGQFGLINTRNRYHDPTFGIELQGSCGARLSPF